MTFIVETFFSGCVSKVINDGKDYSWAKIKRVVNDKNDRNLSTRIYRVIENALDIVTDKKFKDTDDLYETIERIFIEFRDHGSTIESVKCGLGMLNSDVTVERCENFLEKFYEGICQDEELHRRISLLLQEKGIDINQKEFQQLNKTVEYEFGQLNRKVDKIDEKISISNNNEDTLQNKKSVKSRTQEYADKWNKNMFLNDFDKRDKKAGINVKLNEVYLEEHLPHYIWEDNDEEESLPDLKDLLSEYINEKRDNKMLLIFGQPGIGKSTLITWIVANCNDRIDDILVYKFSSDLRDIEWQSDKISNRILEKLNLSCDDLNGRTLILDGFDEVDIEKSKRRDILDCLYGDWIYKRTIDNFSLIITCRENYVQRFAILRCKYITLQSWNEKQIRSFCNIFQEKTKNSVSESTIEKLIKKKSILGIPLILYMVLALNISIEQEGSIVDVYDKIFALKGGIYDRCINNKMFAEKHRIAMSKKQIHQISKEIAIWMFENNPVEAYISREAYHRICDNITKKVEINSEKIKYDSLMGTYFKLVRHCEGVETQKIYFVHRTIYEYFVAETIYSSIKDAMIDLTEESQKEFAGNIVNYLKKGRITNTIGEYLQHKIIKLYNRMDCQKKGIFYQWWEEAVENMIDYGMFYCAEGEICSYRNIIDKEIQCFLNLVKILRLIFNTSPKKYILENVNKTQLEKYIRFRLVQCRMERRNGAEIFDLSNISLAGVNLSGADIKMANLKRANLKGIDLSDTDLSGADLRGVDFEEVNLENANLFGANLINANLEKTNLKWANLNDAIFAENQVDYLKDKYRLDDSKVFISKENKILSYENYCKRLLDF